MKRFKKHRLAEAVAKALLFSAAMALAPVSGLAADDVSALKKELDQLRKEVQELRDSLKAQKSVAKPATQEEVAELRKEVAKSQSEWKDPLSTKHFAGYANVGFADPSHQTSTFNAVNFNPGFHYQYGDLVLLDAELEVTVQQDGGTEVGLEFASVNVLLNDYAVLYAGKFLSQIGQFRQNLHPGWINKLPSAPTGFGHDQAAPTSDVGGGLRGGARLGEMGLNYSAYISNGPRLELNEAGDEIEMIESEGSTSRFGKFAWGGRVGLRPLPKLEFGISGATGKVALEDEASRSYSVFGLDAAYQWRNLDLRAEYVEQKVGDLSTSVAPEGGKWRAWYGQGSYRFAPTKWEAVLRYGKYTTPHADQNQKQWATGLNYVFAPNLIGKLAYEFNDGEPGQTTDDNRFLAQIAYGF